MFCDCVSLTRLPNISRFKFSKEFVKDELFKNCYSLIILPDI